MGKFTYNDLTIPAIRHKGNNMKISVRSGIGSVNSTGEFTDVIEIVDRSPRQHKGWESVRYKNKRYQLFGGIRTDYFISLNNPIK